MSGFEFENCKKDYNGNILCTDITMDGSPYVCVIVSPFDVPSREIGKYAHLNKSGAYLLYGVNDDVSEAYVGKATNLFNRLRTHSIKPETEDYNDRWRKFIAITRIDKPTGFSESEIASLEHRLNRIVTDSVYVASLNKGSTREGIGVLENEELDKDVDEALRFLVSALRIIGIRVIDGVSYSANSFVKVERKFTQTNFAMYRHEMDDIVTPDWMVKQMVDMIPADKFNPNSKFIDLACKRGEFLKEIRCRLYNAPAMKAEFPKGSARYAYIDDHMIYGISLTEGGFAACLQNLELIPGENIVRGLSGYDPTHLSGISDYIQCMKSGYVPYIALNGKTGYIGIEEEISRTLSEDGRLDMKFDVVIGNPPYNNDLYLDFVQTGFKLLKPDGVLIQITPAKWQGHGGSKGGLNDKGGWKAKNSKFYDIVVPHISTLEYWKDSKSVFDIGLPGGLSVFAAYASKESSIKNIKIHAENKVYEENRELLLGYIDVNSVELSIVNKCKAYGLLKNSTSVMHPEIGYFLGKNGLNVQEVYQKYGCKESEADCFAVAVRGNTKTRVPIKTRELRNRDKIDDYKLDLSAWAFTGAKYKSTLRLPKEIGFNYDSCTVCVGTLDECKSADSFYGSKLVWWLCKKFFGVRLNEESFKYVPDPVAFDHIFTDDELYRKYGLTNEEINIIESAIVSWSRKGGSSSAK